MADNRQMASLLALIGGIITIALSLIMGLIFAIFGGMAGMAAGFGDFGGPEIAIVGVLGAFGALMVLVGIGAGVALVVASSKLKDEDPEARRQGATWAIVAGIVSFLGPGSLVSGGLGVAAGVVTLNDLSSRPAP